MIWDRTIGITLPEYYSGEAGQINDLLAKGLAVLHIRKPESGEKNVEQLLESINTAYYNRLAVHQWYDAAAEYGIRRMHLTAKARQRGAGTEEKRLLDAGMTLTTSAHSCTEAAKLQLYYTYVFLSPFYDSISKRGYAANMQLLQCARAGGNGPEVVPLGGITAENAGDLYKRGFKYVAMSGAIFNKGGDA